VNYDLDIDFDKDMNLAVLCGSLATEPELRTYESGARALHFLVTTRAQEPRRRRVDVVPVVLSDPPDELVDYPFRAETRVFVTGSVQRRSYESPAGRRSRIEVIADEVSTAEAPGNLRDWRSM
jgi:single-stranded DNA-binding protein